MYFEWKCVTIQLNQLSCSCLNEWNIVLYKYLGIKIIECKNMYETLLKQMPLGNAVFLMNELHYTICCLFKVLIHINKQTKAIELNFVSPL